MRSHAVTLSGNFLAVLRRKDVAMRSISTLRSELKVPEKRRN